MSPYLYCVVFSSEKSCGRSHLLFPSGGLLVEKFREQRRNQIPRASQGETQGDHGGSRRRIVVFHRCHHIVRVRGEDLQQEETEKTRKR